MVDIVDFVNAVRVREFRCFAVVDREHGDAGALAGPCQEFVVVVPRGHGHVPATGDIEDEFGAIFQLFPGALEVEPGFHRLLVHGLLRARDPDRARSKLVAGWV